MKKTLEEILADYKEITNALIENDGELTEELLESLNINRNEASEKISAYYYVIKNLEHQAAYDKEQKDRFAKRQKARENSAARLKERVDLAVAAFGTVNPKSKGRIPSIVFETEDLRATATPYPVLNPETLPDQEHLGELPEKYLDSVTSMKISPSDAKRLVTFIESYNKSVGSESIPVPQFNIVLNSTLVKSDILEGIEIGEIGILSNYKTRFS